MIISEETQLPPRELAEGKTFRPFDNLLGKEIPKEAISPEWLWPEVGILQLHLSSDIPITGEQLPDPRTLRATLKLKNISERATWQKKLVLRIVDPDDNKFESGIPQSDGADMLEFQFPDRSIEKDPETDTWPEVAFMGMDVPELLITAQRTWSIPGGKS